MGLRGRADGHSSRLIPVRSLELTDKICERCGGVLAGNERRHNNLNLIILSNL